MFSLFGSSALVDWSTERRVWDRIQRQFRAVCDALAWRMFRFDRRYIIAMSRSADPGPMGKEVLPYELGRVQELWEQDGVFGLLHDLTNCLRIARSPVTLRDRGWIAS
jgi:hypothetical protein